MLKTAHELQSGILDLIAGRRDDFPVLAREVFAFQFAHNAPYRAYAESRRRTPATVGDWREIPAVPTAAFKDFPICSFPVAEAVAEFHTSGTTHDRPGKHYLRSLELYEAAIRPWFARHLLPDGARLPMLVLTPHPAEAPHSSLAHMMGVVTRTYASRSDFYVRAGRFEVERLAAELQRATEPVFLLGTAFAFVHLLDFCDSQGISLPLPPGSRLMETGGFKGRSRELSRTELYGGLSALLSVPPERIVNEYGMTELSTQFYDDSLVTGRGGNHKRVPPWARVQVVDPQAGNEAALGTPGMLRIFDLANLWSSMVLQTEDLGIAHSDGFEILGRAAGATVRGCSLTAETLLVGR